MPTPDNRKIISLAALSEFKTLLTQEFNGRYVPYLGAEASLNLGDNNFISNSYLEARNVSNDVINSFTRYRAGSVVISDSSALNTKVINFPTASNLNNSNTFATQEWANDNLVRVNDSISITPAQGSTSHKSITIFSPSGIQNDAYVRLRTYSETRENNEYAFGELIVDGFSGTTKYRRDYIQIGSYNLNFPTLSADKTIATTDQIPDTSNFVAKNNDITGATKCKITYDSKGLVTAGADLTASDIPDLSSVYVALENGVSSTLKGSIYIVPTNQMKEISVHAPTNPSSSIYAPDLIPPLNTEANVKLMVYYENRFWIPALMLDADVGYTNKTYVLPKGVQILKAINENDPVKKYSFNFPQSTISGETGEETFATQEWVSAQGYGSGTGTVTSVTIAAGTGLSVDDQSAITSSGTRTISIASGYKLPTTSEWNGKADLSRLGTAAYANTGTGSGNVPTLDSNGKLSTSVLPALAITDTFVAASQAAMLALTAEVGDVCVRTDLNKSFILKQEPASTLANWQELLTPTDSVLSVNGQTGVVTFDYLSNATVSGQTLTITKSDGSTVSLTDHTYNFSGVQFNSGDSSHEEHNCNDAVSNGHYYYTANGPSGLGESTTDGALYVQSYSNAWVAQIAQDYRNGRMFVRGKNNGTWTDWLRVALTGEAQPASDVYSWAKQPSKPSYNFSEIQPGTAVVDYSGGVVFRSETTAWYSGIYYSTPSEEAVIFANKSQGNQDNAYQQQWLFAYTDMQNRTAWPDLGSSVAMQIKGHRVAINKMMGTSQQIPYNLDVNGSANATTVTVNTHVTMQYNSNEDCLDFIFS